MKSYLRALAASVACLLPLAAGVVTASGATADAQDPPWPCNVPRAAAFPGGSDEVSPSDASMWFDPTDTHVYHHDVDPNISCLGNSASGENIVKPGDTWMVHGDRLDGLKLYLDGKRIAWRRVSDERVEFVVPPHANGVAVLRLHNATDGGLIVTTLNYMSPPGINGVVNLSGGSGVTGDEFLVYGRFLREASLRLNDVDVPVTGDVASSLRFILPANLPARPDGKIKLDLITGHGVVSALSRPGTALPSTPVVSAVDNGDHANEYKGLVGARMTVHGYHLSGATVKVDGKPVPVSHNFDDQLVFVLPPHANGLAVLTLTTAAGTTTTTVNYLKPGGQPTVSGVVKVTPTGTDKSSVGVAGDVFIVRGTNLRNATVWMDDSWYTYPDNIAIAGTDTTLTLRMPRRAAARDIPVHINQARGRAVVFLNYGLSVLTPTVTGLSSANGTVDGRATVWVKGQNLSPLSLGATVEGTAVPTEYVDAQTLRVLMPPHAPGTVALTVTDANAHASTTRAFNYVYRAPRTRV